MISSTPRALGLGLLVAAATVGLLGVPSLAGSGPDLGLDPALGARLRFQALALMLMATVVGACVVVAPASRRFLGIGRLDAPVTPAPWIGLNPGPGETWRHIGRNFALVLPTVTAVAVGAQVVGGQTMTGSAVAAALPWALVLSVSNALVEEGICRFGVVAALADRFGSRGAILSSAVLFGSVHYFGTPGGWPGVLLAGFLGWLLAKSVIETGGMGWALLLHTLVDVPIFTAQLALP
jgi:membrane protease YdiL (CAAX protease family)